MPRLHYNFSNLLGTVYRQGNLLFSPDGTVLFSAVGNRVSGFNLVKSRTFTFPFEARRNIARLALSPDGTLLVAIDDEGHLLLINVLRRAVVHHLNLKQTVADVRFSPDGQWIAFAIGRLVQVWATPALERSFTPFALHKTLGGHGDDVLCLAWSADSLFIASGGKDMNVVVHSVHRLPGYAPPALTGHRSSVRAVFFADDAETLYAVTRDGALSVWQLAQRPDVDTKQLHAMHAAALAEGGGGRGETHIGHWWELAGARKRSTQACQACAPRLRLRGVAVAKSQVAWRPRMAALVPCPFACACGASRTIWLLPLSLTGRVHVVRAVSPVRSTPLL